MQLACQANVLTPAADDVLTYLSVLSNKQRQTEYESTYRLVAIH